MGVGRPGQPLACGQPLADVWPAGGHGTSWQTAIIVILASKAAQIGCNADSEVLDGDQFVYISEDAAQGNAVQGRVGQRLGRDSDRQRKAQAIWSAKVSRCRPMLASTGLGGPRDSEVRPGLARHG